MKKLFIILSLLVVENVFPQGQHVPVLVRPSSVNEANANSDTRTFKITGTGADTSAVFDIYPFMGNDFWAADTSASDSVAITIEFQTCTRSDTTYQNFFDSWKTVESWTITTDSIVVKNNITDNIIPIDLNGRYVITGGATNKKSSAVFARIKHKNFSSGHNTNPIKRR